MKYKAIIFDMDGTLFDTEQISRLAWLEYGKQTGLPVSEEFIVSLIGRSKQSSRVMFDKYMPASFNEEEAFQFHKNFMSEYKKIHGPLPKTDLIALFTYLKEKGYLLALCSSSARHAIDLNLSFEHLHSYFDLIVDGNQVKHGKPAPDIYTLCANELSLDPKECLVIEDSENGILSAHAANMDVIMVVDMVQPNDNLKRICLNIYYHLDEIKQIL
ncbi:MAG: HAD family hydrolase [Traorella sp.]